MNLQKLARSLPVANSLIYDQAQVSGSQVSVSDVHAALLVVMNRGVNCVGGTPVAHVVSPTGVTVLISSSLSDFASGPIMNDGKMGTINGIPIVVDPDETAVVRTIVFAENGDLMVSEVILENISFS